MTDTALPTKTKRPMPTDVQVFASPWRRAFLHAALVAVSFVMLYPLLWMVASSFRPDAEIFTSTGLVPIDPTLDAYGRGWNGLSVGFGRMFLNSAVIAGLVVVGNLISCSMAAYAFTRLRFRGRGFWFALMLGTRHRQFKLT